MSDVDLNGSIARGYSRPQRRLPVRARTKDVRDQRACSRERAHPKKSGPKIKIKNCI
jgi:hypothetical protein